MSTFESMALTLPASESQVDVEANIAATRRLLDVLRAEAERPDALISQLYEFTDDGSFCSGFEQPLDEIIDPEGSGSGYQAGLRPSDGAGQIILLQREKGGVVGRVVMTLRDGEQTRLFGDRHIPRIPGQRSSVYEALHGELASPEMLDLLGARLRVAFDTKRARMTGEQPAAPFGWQKMAQGILGLLTQRSHTTIVGQKRIR